MYENFFWSGAIEEFLSLQYPVIINVIVYIFAYTNSLESGNNIFEDIIFVCVYPSIKICHISLDSDISSNLEQSLATLEYFPNFNTLKVN